MNKASFLRNFWRFGKKISGFRAAKTFNFNKKIVLAGSLLFANATYRFSRIIFFDEPKDDEEHKNLENKKKIEGLSKLVKVLCLIKMINPII